jgi:L-threonylcarbamoyladenylate synthase
MIRLAADEEGVARAASVIRKGGVVIWPSGGVYGFATSALSPGGVARIYSAKGRGRDKPLQVITSPDLAAKMGVLPESVHRVIQDTWPGFVGFVVPRKSPELKNVAGPGDTVLLVCPNWVARCLADKAGVPVVGTSANLSGRPEILLPEEAEHEFVESVDAFLDGGPQSGELNTLIDICKQPYEIVRRGAIEGESVLRQLGDFAKD